MSISNTIQQLSVFLENREGRLTKFYPYWQTMMSIL